jgi:ATP-dependent DNA helicase RecG
MQVAGERVGEPTGATAADRSSMSSAAVTHRASKPFWIAHVPARLPGTAWHHNGRYLKRAGDELTPIDAAELREIFAESGPDFSAELCPGATLGDLDPEAVADFRSRWARKTQDDRRSTWSVQEALANAELLIDGNVTYTALILFGLRAALGRHLAQAEIVFEYRSTEASGPAADREEFREGFFRYHDALWSKVNLRNDRQSFFVRMSSVSSAAYAKNGTPGVA